MRGQARDYDGWGAGDGFGANAGWSWDECLPYFLQARGLLRGRRRVPRRARVRSDRHARRRRMAGREAAPALGHPRRVRRRRRSRPASRARDDFNRGDNEGVGYFEVNQRAGIRWNAAKAFLRPALAAAEPAGLDRRARRARVLLERDAGGARCARRRRGAAGGGGAGAASARARGGEVILARRRDRHAADPAALGHRRRRRCCAQHGIAVRARRCPASARTCRTTCRSAPSTRSRACRR